MASKRRFSLIKINADPTNEEEGKEEAIKFFYRCRPRRSETVETTTRTTATAKEGIENPIVPAASTIIDDTHVCMRRRSISSTHTRKRRESLKSNQEEQKKTRETIQNTILYRRRMSTGAIVTTNTTRMAISESSKRPLLRRNSCCPMTATTTSHAVETPYKPPPPPPLQRPLKLDRNVSDKVGRVIYIRTESMKNILTTTADTNDDSTTSSETFPIPYLVSAEKQQNVVHCIQIQKVIRGFLQRCNYNKTKKDTTKQVAGSSSSLWKQQHDYEIQEIENAATGTPTKNNTRTKTPTMDPIAKHLYYGWVNNVDKKLQQPLPRPYPLTNSSNRFL